MRSEASEPLPPWADEIEVPSSLQRTVLRLLVRWIVRTILRSWMPLGLQRFLLDIVAFVIGAPWKPRTVKQQLAGVEAWFYQAPKGTKTAVLYLHGGGYVAGSPRSHQRLCKHLARRLDTDVHAIDYRLAPEHPFPAAIDDAFGAFEALVQHPRGYDQIVVMGDSAGGGLALATALRARDTGSAMPDAIIALSPLVDLSERVGDLDAYDDMLDPRWADKICRWYLRDHPLDHPWASPLHGELKGFPPTLIQVGGDEILADQGLRMALALENAGATTAFEVYAHLWHVFQTSAGQLPDADEALGRIRVFLDAQLAASGAAS